MTAQQRPADALTAAVVYERFPTYRATLHEAARKPRPIPGEHLAVDDDDLVRARRRRDLVDALDTAHPGYARTA